MYRKEPIEGLYHYYVYILYSYIDTVDSVQKKGKSKKPMGKKTGATNVISKVVKPPKKTTAKPMSPNPAKPMSPNPAKPISFNSGKPISPNPAKPVTNVTAVQKARGTPAKNKNTNRRVRLTLHGDGNSDGNSGAWCKRQCK